MRRVSVYAGEEISVDLVQVGTGHGMTCLSIVVIESKAFDFFLPDAYRHQRALRAVTSTQVMCCQYTHRNDRRRKERRARRADTSRQSRVTSNYSKDNTRRVGTKDNRLAGNMSRARIGDITTTRLGTKETLDRTMRNVHLKWRISLCYWFFACKNCRTWQHTKQFPSRV